MKPRWFLDEIVVPNLEAMQDRPGDVRLVINAILVTDALVGILHAALREAGHPAASATPNDEDFRECLAERCPGYSAVRDTAASLKHGALTRHPKNRIPRVIRTPDGLQTMPAASGLLRGGDDIYGRVAMLCLVNGKDAVRADEALKATLRELRLILDVLSDIGPAKFA